MTERPIDDSAAPVRDAAGNLIGVVMVFRDISELRRRERAVQDALAYAEGIIDTVRDPLVLLRTSRALQATATPGNSAAGSACAMLPTTVPRWRMGGWAKPWECPTTCRWWCRRESAAASPPNPATAFSSPILRPSNTAPAWACS